MRSRKQVLKYRRILLVLSAFVLLLSAGSTAAFLTDAENASNIFTVGAVGITLQETTGQTYPILPGTTISKDPVVTVKGGSEDCWLFLKVGEENRLSTLLTYTLAEGWLSLAGEADVYYRRCYHSWEDQTFPVLEGNALYVPDSLTRQQLSQLTTFPQLSLSAKAVQYYGQDGIPFTPEQAWSVG